MKMLKRCLWVTAICVAFGMTNLKATFEQDLEKVFQKHGIKDATESGAFKGYVKLYGSFSKSAKEALRKFFSKKGYSLKDVFDFNGQLWKKISELDMEGKDLGCFFENGDSLHWKCHWVFLRRMYEFSRYCIQRYGKKWIPEEYFGADLVPDDNVLSEIFSPFETSGGKCVVWVQNEHGTCETIKLETDFDKKKSYVLKELKSENHDYPSVQMCGIVSGFFKKCKNITGDILNRLGKKSGVPMAEKLKVCFKYEHPAVVIIKSRNFSGRISELYSKFLNNAHHNPLNQYKCKALLKGFFYYQTLMWNVYRSGCYEIMKGLGIVVPNLTDDFEMEYSQLLFGRSHSVEEFKFSDEAVCTEVLNDGFLANSETKDALQQNMIDIKPRLKHSDSFTFGLKKRSLKQSEDYGKMYERFTERVGKFLVKDCWMLGDVDGLESNPSDM